MPHTFPIRVYYEDTDAGGVVYYANYLKFAERARTEALRAAAISQQTLLREHGILFVVRACEIEYLRPARLDDCLTIETHVLDSGKVSMSLHQAVKRGGETLAVLKVKLVAVDAGLKPARVPDHVREALETFSSKAAE